MSNYIGDGIASAIGGFIIMAISVAFAAGALCVWLLPKLWHWLKPWIHQVTG